MYLLTQLLSLAKNINHSQNRVYTSILRFVKDRVILPEGRKGVYQFNNEKWEYLEKIYHLQQEMEEKQIG